MPSDTKITLHFRRIPLGVLERTENGYMYTSYPENEQTIHELLLAYGYKLWHSFKRENRMLFPEFEHIIKNCRRKDILEFAGITDRDSRWDKLEKLSRLEWFTSDLYVQQTTDIDEESSYYLKSREKTTVKPFEEDVGKLGIQQRICRQDKRRRTHRDNV